MKRTDPYENKYGDPDYCRSPKADGRKALSSLLADFRETPDEYLPLAGFLDKETGEGCFVTDAMGHGWPFAATLHDHVDHTNLHVRWWIANVEYVCNYKVTTVFPEVGDEPRLDYQLTYSGVIKGERNAEKLAVSYLTGRINPCPCANERVDMWWSLTGRMDETMFHLALMPESNYWMQL